MAYKRIKDLPPSPAMDILRDAEYRGEGLIGGSGMNAHAVLFAGLADIILEMKKEIDALKQPNEES